MSGRAKPWVCSEGHVLGLVKRRTVEGRKEKVLILYRHAIDQESDEPSEMEVMGVVQELTVLEVTCDVCGKTRVWNPSEEALWHLVHRVLALRSTPSMNIKDELEALHATN